MVKFITTEEIANSHWDYPEVEENLLLQIEDNKKENCIQIIEKYEKTIKKHFDDDSKKKEIIKDFVNKLNDILVKVYYSYNFAAVESVLNNELFSEILSEFIESDILIRACQQKNIYTIRWLIRQTNINYFTSDENGMTALMYAAKDWTLVFAVEKLLTKCSDSLFLTDNDGNTALYHSIHNINIFNRILYVTKDINHLNKNNETIIYYCGKNEIYIPFEKIFKIKGINLNVNTEIFINEGKREFVKLVQNDNDKFLNYLAMQYHAVSTICGTDIVKSIMDEIGSSLFTILIKKYYEAYFCNDKEAFHKYICMLKVLIFNLECDVNCAIDEEGNTPMMFFLLIEDYASANYLFSSKPEVDLSIKNNRGINASYLSLFIKEKELRMKLIEHPSFDSFFLDENKDNLITHFMVRDKYEEAVRILSKSHYLLTVPNKNGETTITIAIKSGHGDILQEEFFKSDGLNQQDTLGNTPLHYAVELKDKYAILNLAYYGADTQVKNKDGKTAIDLVNDMKDRSILDFINEPFVSIKKRQSKIKKIFSKITKDSSTGDLASSSEDLSGNNKSNEEFNHTLKMNKKLFLRPKSMSNVYKEDYNYLLSGYKTLYSVPPNIQSISPKLKDFYFIYRTICQYVPWFWAYYLTTSAYIVGASMDKNSRMENNEMVYKYHHKIGLPGDYDQCKILDRVEYQVGKYYQELSTKGDFGFCDWN